MAVCWANPGLPVGFLLLRCSVLFAFGSLSLLGSLLYLDLYVLEDDALMGCGSFMRARYLCVLIHIWVGSEVGAVEPFKPSSVIFFTDRSRAVLLLRIFCVLFCLVFAVSLCASVCVCFVVTCWEGADLLALVCGVLL